MLFFVLKNMDAGFSVKAVLKSGQNLTCMGWKWLFPIAVIAILGIYGCAKQQTDPGPVTPSTTIAEQLDSAGRFSLLLQAAERAGISSFLEDSSYFTLLAPSDEAFDAYGIDASAIAAMSTDSLKELLTYHLIRGVSPSKSMPEGPNAAVPSANGIYLFITNAGDSIYVNGLSISARDQRAVNGVWHEVNGVLIPPAKSLAELIASDSSLTLLQAAILKTEMTDSNFVQILDTLTAISFFAPNNAAFQTAGYADATAVGSETPDSLVRLLSAQLVNGFQFAKDFSDSSYFKPVYGNLVLVRKDPPFRFISQSDSSIAIVKRQDILATNGVLFVSDGILK